MKQQYLNILSLLCLGLIWLVACKKDEFPKKSFVGIENVTYKETKNTLELKFEVEGDLLEDPIDEKRIEIYKVDKVTLDTTLFKSILASPMTAVTDTIIDGLEAGEKYCFRIKVTTSNELSQPTFNEFYYPGRNKKECFTTLKIDVKTIGVIQELPAFLQLNAKGIFTDFNEDIRADILEAGIFWYEVDNPSDTLERNINFDGMTPWRTERIDPKDIDKDGCFTSNVHLYDLNKFYITRAFYTLPNPTPSDPIPSTNYKNYSPISEGDFWVNMTLLPGYKDGETPSGRAGGVSFKIGEEIYMGLGRDASGNYLGDIWRYLPKVNQWSFVGDFPELKRMFAVTVETSNGVYIGSGCRKCHNFEEGIGTQELADTIEILDDFYLFDGTSPLASGSIKIETSTNPFSPNKFGGRFGAYAFNINAMLYLGGGIGSTVIEGDMGNVNRKWFDRNKNGLIDFAFDSTNWTDNPTIGNPNSIDAGEWIDRNCNGRVDRPAEFEDNIPFGTEIINAGEWFDINNDSIFDDNEWIDLDSNNVRNIGNWTDHNNNGIIDNGGTAELPAGERLMTEEWTDLNNDSIVTPNEITIDGMIYTGKLNTTEWIDINEDGRVDYAKEWIDLNGDGLVAMGEITINPTDNPDGTINLIPEWNDNGNGIPDENELTFNLSVKRDLFKFDNNDNLFKQLSITNARFGAKYGSVPYKKTTLPNNINILLLQGHGLDATINNKVYQTRGGIWSEITNLSNSNLTSQRIFPVSFQIGNNFYIGAGETPENDATTQSTTVGFDMWLLENGNFRTVQGCGLRGLTRGISFSTNIRGYVGFGKVGTGAPSKLNASDAFWAYVPKK